MKVQPRSQKLAAINEALSKMPLKRLPVEKVRAQVIHREDLPQKANSLAPALLSL